MFDSECKPESGLLDMMPVCMFPVSLECLQSLAEPSGRSCAEQDSEVAIGLDSPFHSLGKNKRELH